MCIFDDPLSALDSSTGEEVFDRLLSAHGLLKDCAKVLVTHATQYIAFSSITLVLSEGNVIFNGTHRQLQELLRHPAPDPEHKHVALLRAVCGGMEEEQGAADKLGSETDAGSDRLQKSKKLDDEMEISSLKADLGDKDGELMVEEERELGLTGWRVWWAWAQRAGGAPFVILQVTLMCLDRASYVAADLVRSYPSLSAAYSSRP